MKIGEKAASSYSVTCKRKSVIWKYMGRSCQNQVWAITFDWSAQATLNIPHLHFERSLQRYSTYQIILLMCHVTWKVVKWSISDKDFQNLSKCSSGMFISGRCSTPVKSYGRNLIQATSPNVFCLVKELGTKGYGKERFLSLAHFLTFVYLSKCNIKLPGYFGNSKKSFLWTGLMLT